MMKHLLYRLLGGLPRSRRLSWAARLNPFAAGGADPCVRYQGKCTGFGSRQCITAPKSMDPDAEMVEMCCDGWFQYPWIEVCPGEEPRTGCGFCLW